MSTPSRVPATLLALSLLVPAGTAAQDASLEAARQVASLRAEPAEITVVVGDSVPFRIVALDARGTEVEGVQFRVFARGGVDVEDGAVIGEAGGEFTMTASLVRPADMEGETPEVEVPVTVTWPAATEVRVGVVDDETHYAGTTLRYRAEAFHADGSQRPEPTFTWSTSDPAVATASARGHVTALAPGGVDVVATIDGVQGRLPLEVSAFPATTLELTGGAGQVRQGDVAHFDAVPRDASGGAIEDMVVQWSVDYAPDDSIKAPGAAGIVRDGRFVGESPGVYTVVASAGDLVARSTIDVRPREAVRPLEVVGQGSVSWENTSDLWVYEGLDGRDYAVTGTHGGDGWAYFWDVTDPSSPLRTDSIQLDARTVNDVKVSPDGRYAALSREGASSRVNGVVIMDLSDPAHPTVASVYDEGLTGGVHNMFATDDHLFALSGGDKYVILDVTDITNPTYVSEYNHPDSRIHDVWVHDGIAYSSEWANGVVVVDVGNGRWGGTIENPVFVTNVPYPVGRTHAAFPYVQESTGKVYLFLGDEILNRRGAAYSAIDAPAGYRGYIHVIDFTDPENPEDVARYEIQEAGSHNLWVDDDVLYVAYYEGGVRAVDVSGELLGNLATQGREIAVFKAFDPEGVTPNAPMAWGPQPYKGNLFFSDYNSGLWAVRIQPPGRPIS